MADELTVIHSMVADTSNHTPATFHENSGFRLNGFPAMGAWMSYGLGSESDDLPAFVVIPDAREFPAGGSINWTNGFLPARHQGVVIRPARGADRRSVSRQPGRPGAEAGHARTGRGDEPPPPRRAQGEDALAAAFAATKWPHGCRRRFRWSPTSKEEPAETRALYGSIARKPRISAAPA